MTILPAKWLSVERWARLWSALGATSADLALYAQLMAAYGASNRFYHNQQHLAECMHHLQGASHRMHRPHEVELALWFHDAVYDARRGDNEARSAAWAQQALAHAGLDATIGARLASLIRLTTHDAPPPDQDHALLLDIDLAILGADAMRFAQYETQIRQEYAWIPWPEYCAKRATVLAGFLHRPSIYHTEHFSRQFESNAHANLTKSIKKLLPGTVVST